jgi:hypothetical protein
VSNLRLNPYLSHKPLSEFLALVRIRRQRIEGLPRQPTALSLNLMDDSKASSVDQAYLTHIPRYSFATATPSRLQITSPKVVIGTSAKLYHGYRWIQALTTCGVLLPDLERLWTAWWPLEAVGRAIAAVQ